MVLHRTGGILSLIGQTPLLKLDRFLEAADFQLYAKLELFNPGGSSKDRPSVAMLMDAWERGKINQHTTIIESSSGNLGIGLAQVCAYLGLSFICVIDTRSSTANRRVMEAYGATIDVVTTPDPEAESFLAARIKRVQSLLDTIPNSFSCNQYANPNNPKAHWQTMREILDALGQRVDYLICATSTCGTLRGCAEYLAHQGNDHTRLIAVDAEGSAIFGDKTKPRLIPGHGAGIVPGHYHPELAHSSVLVSDLDCVVGCRRLLHREAIFAGGSSGGVLAAVMQMQMQNFIPAGSNCVAIICDRGERYIDTIYNDTWILEHFGDVADLWQASSPNERAHNGNR
jgi:cysteine synthase A